MGGFSSGTWNWVLELARVRKCEKVTASDALTSLGRGILLSWVMVLFWVSSKGCCGIRAGVMRFKYGNGVVYGSVVLAFVFKIDFDLSARNLSVLFW